MLGWRAARMDEAAIWGSVLFAEKGGEVARARAELLGRPVPDDTIHLAEYQAMKQRRGWA